MRFRFALLLIAAAAVAAAAADCCCLVLLCRRLTDISNNVKPANPNIRTRTMTTQRQWPEILFCEEREDG